MLERNRPAADTSDREIVIQRSFDAPPELVFEAWTRAEHLAKWWGPTGFSITTHAFEFTPGGTWRFTMHGPDGTDYPNRIVYEEIVRAKRIVYSHYAGDDSGPAEFRTTVTIEADGAATKLTMRGVFPSKAARDHVVAVYHAIEGGKQTVARLAEHVGALAKRPRMQLSRVFDAPRALVFAAWSKPEHLQKWFAPDGFSMPSCQMELRAGGVFRFAFRGPDGNDYPFAGSFEEVIPDERIVFEGTIHGDVHAVTTLAFEAQGEKTKLTVTQVYSKESDATRGSTAGWTQTLEHLAAFVERE